MKRSIADIMGRSGVKFGTSGARGLADAMTDLVCYAYALGFLQFLKSVGELTTPGTAVVVGGDFRPSTDRIMAAVFRAIADLGYTPVNGGKVPSPAIALWGLEHKVPAIMVTGSHIPDDRNGIKFNKVSGEILKDDEAGMMAQVVEWNDALFDAQGWFREATSTPPVHPEVKTAYVRRYLDSFPGAPLAELRIGV